MLKTEKNVAPVKPSGCTGDPVDSTHENRLDSNPVRRGRFATKLLE
jgi:hypothetical protein